MKQKKAKNEVKRRRHRLIVFSFRTMVVLLILGFILSMYQRSLVLLAAQPDDFALTATALFDQVTVAAGKLTQIADQQHVEVPSPTRTPNEYELDVTVILGELTKGAESLIMTQEALGIQTNTPVPKLAMTATEMVQRTQDAMAFATYIDEHGTFSPFDQTYDDWIETVEESLGFTHPILETVIESLRSRSLSDAMTFTSPSISTHTIWYNYNGDYYVVMLLDSRMDTYYGDYQELLIFKPDNDTVELVFRHSIDSGIVLSNKGEFLLDFNHNGRLNFAITYANYGDCPTSRLMVLELTADGVKDISPPIEEQWIAIYSSYNFLDYEDSQAINVHSSGGYLLKGDYPEDCKPLDIDAIFAWNGERYALIDHLPIPLHGSATPDDLEQR